MKLVNILGLLFFVLGLSFTNGQRISPAFDIQGHRGFRGLYPENGIEGFLRAIDAGVTTLELDVVISADSQVIVSHEPFLSVLICKGPNGELITSESEKKYNLFKMTQDSISRCDCGSMKHPGFPEQKKFFSFKPTLEAVIDTVEKYALTKGIPPLKYNIETKISKKNEGKFTPNPAVFTRLVLEVCQRKNIVDLMFLQSFDVRTLQEAKKRIPNLKIALLSGSPMSPESQIKSLGFQPEVYSSYYKLLNKKQLDRLHAKGILVIPWTVNSTEEMKKLIELGVDGIITDYPDRLVSIVKTN